MERLANAARWIPVRRAEYDLGMDVKYPPPPGKPTFTAPCPTCGIQTEQYEIRHERNDALIQSVRIHRSCTRCGKLRDVTGYSSQRGSA
jgi:hypothetical protein